MKGEIVAVCTSMNKGERKTNVGQGVLLEGLGLEGDAHAGFQHRQVSLLALESIEKMRKMGLDVHPGNFAENLTTQGLELPTLPIGTWLKIGEALLEVSQIGKECHTRCNIYHQAGDCVMPREGIFAIVRKGGPVKKGDFIEVEKRYQIGVITASDKGSRGEREDVSGQVIEEMTAALGTVRHYAVVPDEQEELSREMIHMADELKLDLILTTGGTGLSSRDVTPEATLAVVSKLVPGIPEVMRAKSMEKTNRAMLSRAVAGIRGKTLIINLPGSPKGVRECLEVILPALDHGLAILTGEASECARP